MAEIEGSASWGQTTGTQEGNIRTFANNWSGTGVISGTGDSEKILLSSGNYMQSEIVNTGTNSIQLLQNKYTGGDTGILKYRSGSNVVNCEAAGWENYSGSFASLGYTQLRIEQAWWLTEGLTASDVVAAYRAKGAGSYANSLENLVEDTYTLVDTGHAPDWDDTNGWYFDGVSEYLSVPTMTINQNLTVIIRFSGATVNATRRALFGFSDENSTQRFSFDGSTDDGDGSPFRYLDCDATQTLGAGKTPDIEGVYGCSKTGLYINGVLTDGMFSVPNPFSVEDEFYIGAQNYFDSAARLYLGYIQAIAVYNKELTSTQVAAITNNMEVL